MRETSFPRNHWHSVGVVEFECSSEVSLSGYLLELVDADALFYLEFLRFILKILNKDLKTKQ